ncbi:GAP family protein [Nocardioides conyzicola]|uniref:GAP family protein n=1 Tax=Nocardioides conyzicola TaxID=1651781 RepID=A0ABP8XCQ1_9ACTN
MNGLAAALGDLLPAALGVAISPLPIIATVLMLLSQRARVTAPAFAVGWVLGITAVLVVVLLVAGPDGVDTGGSSDLTSWVKLVLGLLFALLALRTWHSRPRPGVAAEPPKWMASLDRTTPLVALGLGAALSAANPKNLALAVTGGVAIASNDLSTTQTVVSVVVFVVIASLLVAGPVVAFLVAGDRMAGPLTGLKDVMQVHNTAIMVVLFAVLALSNIGKGLGGLLG